MKFRLAAVQFRPEKGRRAENLDRIAEGVKKAASEGADIVLFPESSTTGYILEGGVEQLAQTPEDLTNELTARLQNLDQTVDISLGFYEARLGQSFNSAAYFQHQNQNLELLHLYRKVFLPTYKVFDESRFHQAGDQLGVVETRFGKIGLLVCEDVWHSVLGTLLTVAGCHTILVHAASPARGLSGEKPANLLRYEEMLPALAREHGLNVAMSMLTGFEGGKGFAGGSMIVSPFGEITVQAKTFSDEIVLADLDLDDVRIARQNNPLASDLQERWSVIKSLVDNLP